MTLTEIAKIIDAQYNGSDIPVDSISIDTRQLKPGQLYIAIIGDRFDGHDFVSAAEQQGAAAVIVSKPVDTKIPCLQVKDTRDALGKIAHHHRAQMPAIIMSMTGSCGKTTTKTLLASILSKQASTLSNEQSFNNNIGVPLTLLGLLPTHQYAVCEVGANHPGEIAILTQLVKPDVAAITNAAAAHLEGFGSIEGVARAKAEIYEGLSSDGVAVINADDQYAEFWKKKIKGHRIVTFGYSKDADVRADHVELNSEGQAKFELILPTGKTTIQLQLIGEHNVMNALTAAAMAFSKDIPISVIKAGLEGATASKRRLVEVKGYAGATVIDDSYNANPLSMSAAISVLSKRTGDLIFVLGDMGELGSHAQDMHRKIGEFAKQSGIHHLYCYGELSRYAAEAFGKNSHHYTDRDQLLSALRNRLHQGTTILVKGSNVMGMDKIVKALMEE